MLGQPCAFSGTGPDGYHVARFAWAEAQGIITATDFDTILETVAAGPFTSATMIYDTEQAEDKADIDDSFEPFCIEYGAWTGVFLGMQGWHHYRGQGTSTSLVEIYDACHEAALAWCQPPGRSYSPTDAVTIHQALADAEAYRHKQARRTATTARGTLPGPARIT